MSQKKPSNTISIDGKDTSVILTVDKLSKVLNRSSHGALWRVCSNLVSNNSRKGKHDFEALKGVSFTLKKGDSLGIIGANGAGKSTTFKILTGELQPNIGFAKVDGFDVSAQKSRALEKLGYCPQYDAILKQLSPNEVLKIFARLRGVEAKKINPLVRSLIGKKN